MFGLRLVVVVLLFSCVQLSHEFSFGISNIGAKILSPRCKKIDRLKTPRCVVEDMVQSATTDIPDGRPVLTPSKLFPRLPCIKSSSKDTRIRLARLIIESQSSVDVWIQKFTDTKRDVELHLTRLADEAVFDVGASAERDLAQAQTGNMNELRLFRLTKLWEEDQVGVHHPSRGEEAQSIYKATEKSTARPRVVVLGSGWGAHAVSKVCRLIC